MCPSPHLCHIRSCQIYPITLMPRLFVRKSFAKMASFSSFHFGTGGTQQENLDSSLLKEPYEKQ